jgi:hypothetical protein
MSNSIESPRLVTGQKSWNPAFVKAFLEHKQTRAVRKALKRARAFAVETRKIVDAYQAPIFAKYEFYNDLEVNAGRAERARITDVERLYLSTDEEQCAKFYAECIAAHKTNGYTMCEDQCPALVAEHNVVKLENALLTWASTFFNFDFKTCHLDLRARALALFECK